ncbi:glycine--tRNA ligase subunit beta [Agarivorans sp. B2Z047]|uniref:glycine--tRNA ligase subunit beta n=1 Tax=Agarivorans sp. B2Z047 TaxID=2652721 RepID=UPI00128CE8EF|nr:glycine--tRNA ligase subunit beta [Agarivorans sp. B2Z047]MPW31127.1 glycine--tRNA ligase subunit beta [Agarivorans sp. B2Z047]UQN42905.1 glycine--tRNA ligase subunit beta [Agarivorans sp. B2Z047]
MSNENLLVEIGTEELPPKALRGLAESFKSNVQQSLEKAGFEFTSVEWYAAPRRLALSIQSLSEQTPDKVVEKRGPAISSAFDADGNATKAAEGWARSNGITVDQAERLKTDKGEWLLHKAEISGQSIYQLFPEIVADGLAKLPIPKPMRWGAKSTQFIRPVHTITMLYGEKLVQGNILGIESARTVRGHRFMGEAEFELNHANDYVKQLDRRGKVIVDYQQRKAIIREQIEAEAAREGGVVEMDEALLEEVCSLVEWPVAMVGSFEEKFLEVPAEALIYTMKDNQKYFPILDTKGNLLPRFIFVSNIVSKDPQQVIEGNEKVVRPRLADAEFFFETDKKSRLDSRLDKLANVVFQQKLGSLLDKANRVSELAAQIAAEIGGDSQHAQRAGLLSKADLNSEMVLEFPDIQGVMGMYYAKFDGEHEDVANALNQQYWPRFSGDKLPESKVASAVAIADKLDTLVGIFAIGQLPKGDKDPFALRRASLGIIRIIQDKGFELDLDTLINSALLLLPLELNQEQQAKVHGQLIEFVYARLRAMYLEQGIDASVITAVLERKPTKPADIEQRIKAVSHFRSLEQAQALAAANKRVSNILAKNPDFVKPQIDSSLLKEPQEKALAEAISAMQSSLKPLLENGDYQAALIELATLREVVDNFFDNVMVMSDEDALKINRLSLLNSLRELFLEIADISVIQ